MSAVSLSYSRFEITSVNPHMSTATPTTAEQLASMTDDGKRYELVNGELRMMSPTGGQHGRIAFCRSDSAVMNSMICSSGVSSG